MRIVPAHYCQMTPCPICTQTIVVGPTETAYPWINCPGCARLRDERDQLRDALSAVLSGLECGTPSGRLSARSIAQHALEQQPTAAPAPPPAVSEDVRVERAARAAGLTWIETMRTHGGDVPDQVWPAVARAVIEAYEGDAT